MKSMLAPVKRSSRSKRTVTTPVTVVLTINDNSKVGKVCGKGPRINDALLSAWWEKPMVASYLFDPARNDGKTKMRTNRTPEQKTEDARLLKIINRAVGKRYVDEILVLKGASNMGGGAITKLPFSSVLGCIELEQREKEEKAKKKES